MILVINLALRLGQAFDISMPEVHAPRVAPSRGCRRRK